MSLLKTRNLQNRNRESFLAIPILSKITSFRLNESNYLRWSQFVQMYIRGRGKLGYLTGERLEPDIIDPQYVVWDAENSMVMTWLVNSMEEDISSNYMCYSATKELSDSVTEMYSDLRNKSQIYELTLQAREIRQGGDNVTRYFHSLKRVRQDLDLFNTYKWRYTEDAKHHQETVEEGRIFQFLAGLNEELDEVRGRIIGRATLPSLGEVFAEVRREETRRNVMMGNTKVAPTPPETNALVVEAAAFKSSTNQKNSSNLWCDHCNKPRHTREICWKIHGRPAHIKGSKSGPKAPRPFPTAHEEEKTSLSKEQVEQLIRLLNSSSLSEDTNLIDQTNEYNKDERVGTSPESDKGNLMPDLDGAQTGKEIPQSKQELHVYTRKYPKRIRNQPIISAPNQPEIPEGRPAEIPQELLGNSEILTFNTDLPIAIRK
ncbi:hypothetical protein SESBI_14208 [Sesbania bispinosa]|nr:hypothetical protein SESBI_14208 [Sesbania bispinosa]